MKKQKEQTIMEAIHNRIRLGDLEIESNEMCLSDLITQLTQLIKIDEIKNILWINKSKESGVPDYIN